MLLKVRSSSPPLKVAGAIAHAIREDSAVHLQTIGAGATNQAVKAIAIARSFLMREDIEIVMIPSFHDVEIEGEIRTALRFWIGPRGSVESSAVTG